MSWVERLISSVIGQVSYCTGTRGGVGTRTWTQTWHSCSAPAVVLYMKEAHLVALLVDYSIKVYPPQDPHYD